MTHNLNIQAVINNTSQYPDQLSCDNPERVRLGKSLWQRITHFGQKRQLDHQLHEKVVHAFRDRYHFQHNDQAFTRIWDKIGAKIWSPEDELTAGALRKIDDTFRKELIYHGKGIHAPSETSAPTTDRRVHQLVNILLHGGHLSHKMIEKGAVQAILIKHPPDLMADFQTELQNELFHLANNLPANPQEELVWRAFLGNVMALLPLSYPADGQTLSVPILKDGVCTLVDYRIEVMQLELTRHVSAMTALGLMPIEEKNKDAPPLLSFLPTTFPSASGYAATILADFTPGHSVGEAVYKRNKEKIGRWMEGKQKVHVFGTSLGGAMGFHTLGDHHEKMAVLNTYNPPGLYANDWKKDVAFQCKVNIFNQPGDLVSELGTWPTGDNVSLYTVYAHQKGVKENILGSHTRAFTGCDKITIVKEDPAKVNQSFRRRFLTVLHKFLGPFLVFIPVCFMLLLYRLASAVHEVSRKIFQRS